MVDLIRTKYEPKADQIKNTSPHQFLSGCYTSGYKKLFRPQPPFKAILNTFMMGCHSEHSWRRKFYVGDGSQKAIKVGDYQSCISVSPKCFSLLAAGKENISHGKEYRNRY